MAEVWAATGETDLAEEAGVQAGQFGRHVLLVHVVELMEGSPGGEAALHQVQHRHHTCGRKSTSARRKLEIHTEWVSRPRSRFRDGVVTTNCSSETFRESFVPAAVTFFVVFF